MGIKHVTEEMDGYVVIYLSGELTAGRDTEALIRYINDPDTTQYRLIVLEISEVYYINSTGLGFLIRASINAQNQNIAVALVSPTSEVDRILRTSRAIQFLPLFRDLDSAIQACLTNTRTAVAVAEEPEPESNGILDLLASYDGKDSSGFHRKVIDIMTQDGSPPLAMAGVSLCGEFCKNDSEDVKRETYAHLTDAAAALTPSVCRLFGNCVIELYLNAMLTALREARVSEPTAEAELLKPILADLRKQPIREKCHLRLRRMGDIIKATAQASGREEELSSLARFLGKINVEPGSCVLQP